MRLHRMAMRAAVFVSSTAMLSAVSASAQMTRDSAGIRIVTNSKPQWTATTAWHVRAAPTVDIGVVDGRPEYELHDVMGAVRLSTGTIVIANQSTSELRYYDANGRFLAAAGRKGQGPAEFQQLMGVFTVPGDTVVGLNSYRGWERFTAAGKPAGSIRFAPSGDSKSSTMVSTSFLLADATAFGEGSRPAGAAASQSGSRYTDSMSLFRLDRTGRLTGRLPMLPAMEYSTGAGRALPIQFGPFPAIASDGQKVYFAFGNEYAVRIMSPTGTLERIIRRPWTPRPITDADHKAFIEDYTNPSKETVEPGAVPSGIRALRLRKLEMMTFASTLPAIGGLLVDAERNVWVRDSYVRDFYLRSGWGQVPDSTTRWSVFGSAGRWLGDVMMPARFKPFQITTDAVLGLFRDDDDVEHVRVHLIDKPRR